jgi:hypothetical protein
VTEHKQEYLYYMPKTFRTNELGAFTRGLDDKYVVLRVDRQYCVLTVGMMRAMIESAERSK